ncbi:uncharacterized protein LOC110876808 [Helianthus annuus]|uniref:uncharacterized protein LOC110876808 n=1 Tax=Helianthus annuus TaxID=4232 RepID=UPI000B8F180D|nr:uncharacterized protein LOC110876808 [Helianthus annuus]
MDEVLVKEGISIKNKLRVKVGDGSGTRFWKDVWIGQSTLKGSYPAIYQLAKNKNGLVADCFLGRNNTQWAWDWLRNPASVSEWVQTGSLLTVLHQTQISDSKDQWNFENSEGVPFSVKDVRKQLVDQTTLQSFVQPFDWNNWAALKVNFLAWRALMGKVASKVGLIERGVSIPNNMCDRCGIGIEDVDHLFASCLFARSIWWNIFAWIRVPFPLAASSLAAIFEYIKHSPGSSKWRKTVLLVILATVWRIWMARNKENV